jgi:acyl-CoA synthetase (NDP forming)
MKVLGEIEAENFLEKEGFPVTKRSLVENEKELIKVLDRIKFPVTMKVSSKKILHKTDVGGVEINIKNKVDAFETYKRLYKISKKVLIEEFIEGHKVIVGLKKDPVFDHVLVFGLGGIFVEVIKDISFRICPVTVNDCDKMIKEIKGYRLLQGLRGKPSINFKRLINVLLLTSRLSQKYKNIKELDINPLIVNEKEAIIVDARIVFE